METIQTNQTAGQTELPKPNLTKQKPTYCSLCGRKELANGLCGDCDNRI